MAFESSIFASDSRDIQSVATFHYLRVASFTFPWKMALCFDEFVAVDSSE